MSQTLYWFQGSACGGDTFALLDVESPDLGELLAFLDIEVLWQPSLSAGTPKQHKELVDAILSGEQPLDFLCLEGAVVRGPGGTGMYDTWSGRPKKDILAAMAAKAKHTIAIGTCAAFGGIGADGEIEATGLQYYRSKCGGFLGESYRSGSGNPVINLPGCPCHGDIVAGALSLLAQGQVPPLNEFNAPDEWYGVLVHQGCVRNEYHEYRVEEREFGERGCMFFHLGCRGPIAHGPCNKLLWNRRSAKTRVGVPCVGCTEPDFPQADPFFQTHSIADIPLQLPDGVDRAHYLAYKGMAAAAAPERLRNRKTRV